MRKSITFGLGLVVGAVLVAVAGWTLMPSMMLTVHPSRYGFEETVALLQKSTEEKGWKVSKVYDIQATLKKSGYADMTPATILSLCQPDHAARILSEDANKKVLAVMPCRVGVYQASDGRTYVSSMDIGLMGKMFGGTIAQVMSVAGAEEAGILASVVAE